MPVIRGFDLSQMSFGKFSSKAMFKPGFHLRKERLILYQVAMVACLAAECTATYSLAKHEALQGGIENTIGGHLYQNDLIDAEIVTIVFCVLVAVVYGAEFFFLVQFPRQAYPAWYQRTKLASAVSKLLPSGIAEPP